MTEKIEGIKTIQIHARCSYPIVSAYEFEVLKTEEEVQALLKPCTIYFIVQRPLVYFADLQMSDGLIKFSITDRTESEPLQCAFDPRANDFAADDEDLLVDLQFYREPQTASEPFDDVAGFKLRKLNGDFMFWMTPQKFIHHVLTNRLDAQISGNILDYIDYRIHYIGQAFSQDVWDRLTGHEKLQSIITSERPLDEQSVMPSYEISLILLDIAGYDEANIFPYLGFGTTTEAKPIVFRFDFEDGNTSFEDFYCPQLAVDAPELTNEVEAMLVNRFKPKYNKILFKNYPGITNGTRNAGYTESHLVLESLPASLSTDNFTQPVVLPGEV